jgi:uncharacterized protein (DUF736 family)
MPAKEDELGGLWERTTRDGKVYMTGKVGGRDVVLFRNEWKKDGETTPDWRVYKSQPRTGENSTGATNAAPRAAQERIPEPQHSLHEEDDYEF